MTHRIRHVAAVIPAAGRGTRLGGQPKQYRQLGDETLLARTVRLFQEHTRISSIVVAAPAEDVGMVREALTEAGFDKLHDVVTGGASRQESVAAASRAAPSATTIVLVHDAARPFLPPDRIDAVIDAVEVHGAAALAVPVTDTLRRVEDNVFSDTVRRDDIFRMQTPQGFRKEWLVEAHEVAQRSGFVATDDVALLEHIGRSSRIVRGSALNFKVTTPEDWLLAEALWHHLATTP